jgi:hypothetical protein
MCYEFYHDVHSVFMFIIIAVLLLIPVIEICSGYCSTSDEGETQSDISIESENTLLHELSILIRDYVLFIYTCSKKLGPIYIQLFKAIRPYLYTRVQSRDQLLNRA